MRSLHFTDITEAHSAAFTYLSPDIEYFHGCHITYLLIAILFALTIVIGLPLYLALDPLLRHRIRFTMLQPLLNQFQECFKENYHYFAAFYFAVFYNSYCQCHNCGRFYFPLFTNLYLIGGNNSPANTTIFQ